MPRALEIGSRVVQDDGDCYVIAEVGHNHQGSVETARRLFEAAAAAGVDAVKLQKRDNRTLFTREFYERPYTGAHSFGATYGAHREALEFSLSQLRELRACARDLGVDMLATVFDEASADAMAELEVPAFKIASGDLTNLPLLEHVAGLGRPLIVSTAGGTLDDVQRAHDTVRARNPQLALLQCTAVYPARPDQLELRTIESYRRAFPETVVGLSDHDAGAAMALVAYGLGARILEKHITLDRASKGSDHGFSLEPPALQRLVSELRDARRALGSGVKQPLPEEAPALLKLSKKLVAARDLPGGHRLRREDVAIKSPGDGLPPSQLDRILGHVTRRALSVDAVLDDDALLP